LQLYAGNSLVRVENPGRGDCGFMTFGEAVGEDHLVVRKKAAAELRTHPELYAPSLGCTTFIERTSKEERDVELVDEEAPTPSHSVRRGAVRHYQPRRVAYLAWSPSAAHVLAA